MLDFQLSQYPFRLGLAEGTDPRQVPPGTLVTAENCVWKQSGRLEKRFGVSALAATGSGSASRLFTRGTELCLAYSAGLLSYTPSSTSWRSVGKLSDASPTWTTLVDQSLGVSGCDAAISSSGLLVTAWTEGDPTQISTAASASDLLYVQVTDSVSGAVVMAPTNLLNVGSFMGVRVFTIGTKAYVISRLGAASPYTLEGFIIDLTTFAVTHVQLRNDVTKTSVETGWDAHVIGSTIYVAYNQTGPNVRVASFSTSLAAGTAGSLVAGSGCEMISLCGTTVLYVLYSASGATPRPVKLGIMNPTTLAVTVAPVIMETPVSGRALAVSCCEYDANNCVISYLIYTGLNELYLATAKVSNTAVQSTTTRRRSPWLTPLTRPFMLDGRCYQGVVDGAPTLSSNSQFNGYSSGVAEIEFTDNTPSGGFPPLRLVAKVDDITGGTLVSSAPRPAPIAVSSTRAQFPMPFLSTVAQSISNWRCGTRLVTLDVGATRCVDWGRSFTYGQETYIAGSGLAAYDGRAAFDYGFFRAPQIDGSTTSAAGGVILAGTYLYATLQEYRSAAGMLHRSPTAYGVTLTTSGATSSNTLNIDGMSFTNKQNLSLGFAGNATLGAPNPTLLPVYRSTVGGSTLQRLSYEPTYNVIEGDASTTFIAYTDTAADSDITHGLTSPPVALGSRPALYTTGGILDDEQPPASVTMFHHADRLWVLAGDQHTWWYSKAFQDDAGTAPGFNIAFRLAFDDVQTAGATMDDKAIFFSATGVRYMLGTGPAANGQNSDFTAPVVIQSDVGCTNARSVVGTPDGVMFLSDRGIYLLTRGLELAWIGRDVKDELAAYPTVTSAVLVAKQNIVRFTCNTTDGTAGIALVYDYVQKQWTTAKYHDGTTYGCAIADACMWNGAWTFATPAGLVFTESTSSYLDGSRYVPMTLETAWISASGPLAFQSVREFQLHGQSYTDHDLTISVGFDSDTSYPQVATFLATSAVTSVGVEEVTVSIGTRRKCETIRFKIADSTPSAGTVGLGRGPAFDMMGLEIGMKRGFASNPATKRA